MPIGARPKPFDLIDTRCQDVPVNFKAFASPHDVQTTRKNRGTATPWHREEPSIACSLLVMWAPSLRLTIHPQPLVQVKSFVEGLGRCQLRTTEYYNWHHPKWTSIGNEDSSIGIVSAAERHASLFPFHSNGNSSAQVVTCYSRAIATLFL